MRIATANLGRGVSTATFKANVKRLVARLSGAIVCFQEIDEDDLPPERRIVGLAFRGGWWFAGRRTRVLIAVPKTWKRVTEKVIKACDGIAGVTPDRFVTIVQIQHRLRKKLHPIVVMDIHFPYVRPGLSAAVHRETQSAWNQCFAELKHQASYYADTLNRTVFICMDANMVDMPKPHPDARLLVGQHGIDKIWVIERSVDVAKLAEGTVDLTIDGHNGHVVRVSLK